MLLPIYLTGSDALFKWLNIEQDDFPVSKTDNHSSILTTHTDSMCWQCHVISISPDQYLAIAVETFSQYALVFPCHTTLAPQAFEHMLLNQWGNELFQKMVETGALSIIDLEDAVEQFLSVDKKVSWVMQDRSDIWEHIKLVEKRFKQSMKDQEISLINTEFCRKFCHSINENVVRVPGYREGDHAVTPVVRLVDDGLFRFGKGLSRYIIPGVDKGNFPNPHELPEAGLGIRDNVVKLDKFR